MIWLSLALIGILYAMLAGYWIHRAIHTRPEWFDKKWWRKPFKFISTSHMGHHALAYGPRMIQAPSRDYFFERNQNEDAVAKKHGWLLLEFVVPAVPFLAFFIFGMWFVGFVWFEILFSLIFVGIWVSIFFIYVHDAFHKFDHWLTRNKLTKKWFIFMRAAHWRHHFLMNQNLELPYNNGISSPLMDFVFRTWKSDSDLMKYTQTLGQVTKAPHTNKEYEAFYKQYDLEEPMFDEYLDPKLEKHLE